MRPHLLETTRLSLDEHIGLAEASLIVARALRAWRSQFRSGMPAFTVATNCLRGMVTVMRVMTTEAKFDLMIEPYGPTISVLASRSRKHDEPQESAELIELLIEYRALCHALMTRYTNWSLQRRAYLDIGRPDWAGPDLLAALNDLLRSLTVNTHGALRASGGFAAGQKEDHADDRVVEQETPDYAEEGICGSGEVLSGE